MAPTTVSPPRPATAADDDVIDAVRRAEALFRRGDVSAAAAALGDVDEDRLADGLVDRYRFLVLGVALFRGGFAKEARALNHALPLRFEPTLRYRLALRDRDIALAKRIRSQSGVTQAMRNDFHWSAALRRLWDGHLKSGLALYRHRHGAINFGRFTPNGAIYRPYRGADETGIVFLEQGVGDALLHLGVMKSLGRDAPRMFVGPRSLAGLVQRQFPRSAYRTNDLAYEDFLGQPMHASGDFLAVAYAETGRFRPTPFGSGPKAALYPKFGVCWRGGSAQNRREERRFDLRHFLDLLPIGPRYVALQADLTEEERALLLHSDRIQPPDFDITADHAALFDLIATLAGVIGVDSANWHFAGLAGTPILALMNETAHWYWAPRGDVGDVYPSATTIPKNAATRPQIATWIGESEAAFSRRPAPALHLPSADGPVFITGAPRSGTSMVAEILSAAGVWMGETIPSTRDNPRGFFENRRLREDIVKPNLAAVGADPLGVRRLPDLDRLAPDPRLRARIMKILAEQGYDGVSLWGYKEPKLALVWPLWVEAFPDASWIIVDRPAEDIAASCLRTGFMRRHSFEREFWLTFVARYRERLAALERAASDATRISSAAIAAGDVEPLQRVIERLGKRWTPKCDDAIRPTLFGRAR